MLPPERILFPIDENPASLAFAESVLSLAVKCRAMVVLLDTNQLAVRGRVCTTPMTRFWENASHDVNIEWKFDSGPAVTQILKTAAPQDLVMMPYAPGGMLKRWFGRVVVETVLNNCASAVWAGSGQRPSRGRMKIACAVDLHADSGRVALNAAFLARTLDASLILLHVLPNMDEGVILLSTGDDLPVTLNEQVARRELEAIRPVSQECSAPLIVRGDPPQAIRSALRKADADLLVIGPGRQAPGAMKLGGHVLDIVRASTCPVLVLDKELPQVFDGLESRLAAGQAAESVPAHDCAAV